VTVGDAPPVAAADQGGRPGREIWAVASVEALDGFRSRRQLLVRAVTPIVLFACVLGITLALRGADTRTHPDAYRVAVQGDFAGAQRTLRALNPERLVFYPATDAKIAAVSEADAGMAVPDGLDAVLEQHPDTLAPVQVFQVTLNPPSRAAAILVKSGFADMKKRQVVERLGSVDDGGQRAEFTLDIVNVERTEAGTRTITSQVIPGLVLLQAAMLVAGTSNRLVSRRTRGLLMAQLVLPVSRRALALAKGLGELAIGTLTAAPVIVVILAFGVASATTGSVNASVHLVLTAFTMLTLFAFTTALGVVIGTAARTQEQVSLATGAALIVATLVATTVALSEVARPAWISIIPVVGSVSTLRDLLNGTGSVVAVLVAGAFTLLGAFLLVLPAGRALDAERMVMRNG
jgi:hypothetical protein